jgi:surface-anchored protein
MNAVARSARSARSLAPLAVAVSLAFAVAARAEPIILSSGHVDIFEAEYELHEGEPELHLGVHTDDGHYEPGDVILEVKNAAYRSTIGLQPEIQTFLGPNAWVLPADLEQAGTLGVLEAGVAKKGFPTPASAHPVTFTMVTAGAANPGKFVLFSAADSDFTRLRADGGSVEVDDFTITAGHIHYFWGFSAPGTYTFDMQASYNGSLGSLQSPVETYTFQVVPEPSTWALAGTALLGVLGLRRRFRRPVA